MTIIIITPGHGEIIILENLLKRKESSRSEKRHASQKKDSKGDKHLRWSFHETNIQPLVIVLMRTLAKHLNHRETP